MRQAGWIFETVPAPGEELTPSAGEQPEAFVLRNAEAKARAVAQLMQVETLSPRHTLILCADTVVAIDQDILGKPCTRVEAESHLRRLAGRWHTVFTGVVLASYHQPSNKAPTSQGLVVRTEVEFARASDGWLSQYVASGEGDDKAGAYGIQGLGASWVRGLRGSLTNVIGLPMLEVESLLEAALRDTRR